MKTKFEISAGGVVFKKVEGRVFVVLIAVKGGKIWTLPKGLVEKGEKLEDAALREVKEETGVTGQVLGRIDKIELWFFQTENGEKVRHHKIVYYFLIKYTGGDVEEHDWEVDDVRWFEIEEAMEMASYKKDKAILKKAYEMIKSYAESDS